MLDLVLAIGTPVLQNTDPSGPAGLVSGPDLTRYLLVCGLLVLGIGALGWGFKRLLAGSLSARAAKRSLRIVDVLPLGGRQKLAVVRCYDRTFVLGLGDKEVGLVAELEDSEPGVLGGRSSAQDLELPSAPRDAQGQIDFEALLGQVHPQARAARAEAERRRKRGGRQRAGRPTLGSGEGLLG